MTEDNTGSIRNEQAPGATFTHQQLKVPSEQIRLVQVQFQQPGKPLELRLSVHSLTHKLRYYAVSYTWGDPEETQNLVVDGKLMTVTKNCHYALTQIQSHYPSDDSISGDPQPIYLWIDSICIDQTSSKEKGHQVAMMGSIYAKASKVLACIGPHEDGSERLAEVLGETKTLNPILYAARDSIDNHIQHEYSRSIMNEIDIFISQYVRKLAVLREDFGVQFRQIFLAFATRSYWSRVWIIQEVAATARSGCELEVLCGTDRFSRSEVNLIFYITGYLFNRSGINQVDDIDLFWIQSRHRFKFVMGADPASPIHAPSLLEDVDKSFKCRQPEDRIYGLLSLLKWPQAVQPVQPDYGPSATINLAELMISIQPISHLSRVEGILKGLEIRHDLRAMEELVAARSDGSHATERRPSNYPARNLSKGINNYHCAVISRNDGNQLTAFFVRSDEQDMPTTVVDQKASELLSSPDADDKAQLLFTGSDVVALLCSAAQVGDVIVESGFGRGLLVLRRTNEAHQYDIIGQGIICTGYRLPSEVSDRVKDLEHQLKGLRDIEPVDETSSLATREGEHRRYRQGRENSPFGDPELERLDRLRKTRAALIPELESELRELRQTLNGDFGAIAKFSIKPIDLVVLAGQDLEKDGSYNADKTLQRLTTKVSGTAELN
ncbi:Heterokaryon incompatibility 6 OR allele [Fusarium albosuccineum]|uniref:Heterokaryon incompatibility 6 OR allele n=1 Tax=Fusarium albosuccineum TaxID=1237068 RepID=A0A8H4PF86_9HYPO|nr:Heterokaryon incompatibility 6 OR allele [Fusarium albosuccineum]